MVDTPESKSGEEAHKRTRQMLAGSSDLDEEKQTSSSDEKPGLPSRRFEVRVPTLLSLCDSLFHTPTSESGVSHFQHTQTNEFLISLPFHTAGQRFTQACVVSIRLHWASLALKTSTPTCCLGSDCGASLMWTAALIERHSYLIFSPVTKRPCRIHKKY